MVTLVENVVLALLWAALTGEFTLANLLLGFLVGTLLLWMGRRVTGRATYFEFSEKLPSPGRIAIKLFEIAKFIVIFLWEVVLANISVALLVLAPSLDKTRPAIIGVPLDITSNDEITLFANMITLTPGTLSIDVSDDQRVLYVHSVHVDDPEESKRELKEGFENLVAEVLG